jgi:hypothetical protein
MIFCFINNKCPDREPGHLLFIEVVLVQINRRDKGCINCYRTIAAQKYRQEIKPF